MDCLVHNRERIGAKMLGVAATETAVSVNTSKESGKCAWKGIGSVEVRESSLDPIASDTSGCGKSPGSDGANEMGSIGEGDNCVGNSKNSLNFYMSSVVTGENSLNSVTMESSNEIRGAGIKSSGGKVDDMGDRDKDSSSTVVFNTVGNGNSPIPASSETLNEIRNGDNSILVASKTNLSNADEGFVEVGNGSSSNLVSLGTVNEIKSLESWCSARKDENFDNSRGNSLNPAVLEPVIEATCREAEQFVSGDSVSRVNNDLLERNMIPVQNIKAKVDDPSRGPCVIVDVKGCNSELDGGNCDNEKVCRICHLSSDPQSNASDMIQLGCECKDELGIVHRHCAEAWFKLKGNRWCEICGVSAKNIIGVGDNRFLEEWNDERIIEIDGSSHSHRPRCWPVQPFCNFVMACLVIAFILPWFFRVNMF